jgi:hypothetical protein
MSSPVCANCGITIGWQPTIVDNKTYCCLGCAQGGPCECDYDNLPQPGVVKAMVLKRTLEFTAVIEVKTRC